MGNMGLMEQQSESSSDLLGKLLLRPGIQAAQEPVDGVGVPGCH